VPDPYKIQRPKAFVVLEEGVTPTEEFKKALIEHCRKNIARYAMPKEFEFRDSLPKTGVGKIAYTQLEAEEAAKSK
jgi:long-chain acyl-CoA synthetase